MAGKGVILHGLWCSPYALRVEWALKLKGIQYKYVEEDLGNKSPLLLHYNPVYKKIPVLVHDGKPVIESLLILEYVDEVWKDNPLLPQDPHERAKARFWAKFADDKCVPAMFRAFTQEGEEKEKSAKEVRENLKILESGLEGKQFFGGETIGFLDIAVGLLGLWARIVGEIVDANLMDPETMPSLNAWFNKFIALPVINECAPPFNKLLEHNKSFRKILTAKST